MQEKNLVHLTFLRLGRRENVSHSYGNRRRIKTEEKAKVVSSVWGAEFIQFLAALAVCTGRFE